MMLVLFSRKDRQKKHEAIIITTMNLSSIEVIDIDEFSKKCLGERLLETKWRRGEAAAEAKCGVDLQPIARDFTSSLIQAGIQLDGRVYNSFNR